MEWIKQYRLEKISDQEYNLVIFIDEYKTEFGKIGGKLSDYNQIKDQIDEYIKKNFKNIKVNVCKIMLGGLLIASIPISAKPIKSHAATTSSIPYTSYVVASGDSLYKIASTYDISVDDIINFNNLSSTTIYVNQELLIPIKNITYTVAYGDTLYKIAGKFNTSIDNIKSMNNLTSDNIYTGQVLKIGQLEETVNNQDYEEYTVQLGDSLYKIASKFGTTIASIMTLNNLTSDNIYTGQVLKIEQLGQDTTPIEENVEPTIQEYTVKAGDSLWAIANQFDVSINNLKQANNLTTDIIYVGQILIIPQLDTNTSNIEQPTVQEPTITYTTHTVRSGDNLWNLSVIYRIPMQELMSINNLNINSMLSIGQVLTIPVHNIPIKEVMGSGYGELLDWWDEAQYVFAINDVATIIDFETKQSFQIKRTIGANHADCEPLTASDTAIAKSVWGGFSWRTRPVLVKVGDRTIAGSMSFMPHNVQYINNNNFNGHFDIHFLNSTRHVDGLQNPDHQADILVAAGVSGS